VLKCSAGINTHQRMVTNRAAAVPLFPTRVSDPVESRQQYSVSPDGQRSLMNIVSEALSHLLPSS
jgi:hypothetical protein